MKVFGSTIAREEFEIEKLIDKDNNSKSEVFEEVYNDVKDHVEKKEEAKEEQPEPAPNAAQAESSSAAEPGDRVTGDSEISDSTDSGEDTDTNLSDDDKELLEDVKDDSPKESISTEQLREILTFNCSEISLEFFEEGDTPFDDARRGDHTSYIDKPFDRLTPEERRDWGRAKVGEAGGKIAQASKWLWHLGIKLGTETLPKFASQAYKGTIYAFNKLAYAFSVGSTALDNYITRRVNSFSNLSEEIGKAKKALELLNGTTKDISNEAYTDKHALNQLSIGNAVNLTGNIDLINKFIQGSIKDIGLSIKKDINSIEQMISHTHLGSHEDILRLLVTDVKITGLTSGSIPGFETSSTLINTYHSKPLLPGNTCLICRIPTSAVKTREEWTQAYKESEMFLGIDRKNHHLVEKLPFLDHKSLMALLDKLESLCKVCIEHQSFYEGFKKIKLHQKLVYKNYFNSIVRRDKKAGIKESLIDLVILKNNFIDKVYLPAAIDIHDYSVRVINANLKFIAKNIHALKD